MLYNSIVINDPLAVTVYHNYYTLLITNNVI